MTKYKSFENISKKHYELLIKAMPEYKDSCLKAVDKLLNVALEQPNLTYEDGFAHEYEAHGAEQGCLACVTCGELVTD